MADAFLTFYSQHQVSPVRQDLSDLTRHLERRDALYRHLGIPPGHLRGRRVLEVGPGSGHNALHTSLQGPARYVLVEANPTGLADTRALLEARGAPEVEYALHHARLEEFETAERFDLVLCEGMLPWLRGADAALRRVARLTAPGGLLVITTCDSVGHLSETLRRLLAAALLPPGEPLEAAVARLRPVFDPHLDTLPGMSRLRDDWVIDQILQPYLGDPEMLPISRALEVLDPDFEVYGSSPHFLTDWRWYKDIHGQARRCNARAREGYLANLHSFLDFRSVAAPRDPDQNARLLELAARAFVLERDHRAGPSPSQLEELGAILDEIADDVDALLPETAAAVAAFRRALPRLAPDTEVPDLGAFVPWWGRGQQYLSFVRVPES